MISGFELRKFREQIGWNQSQLADALGVTQSALSMIERGRILVSQAHIDRLEAGTKDAKPTFKEYLAALKTEHAHTNASLFTASARHSTLPVYRWEEGLDLSRKLFPSESIDLVTVRTTERACIAFMMARKTDYWQADEIIVLEECGPESLQPGDLCLIQIRQPRAKFLRNLLATVKVSRAAKTKQIEFLPISPAGPALPLDNSTMTLIMRCIYRATYSR